ncbi:shikimate dehydrogenase [Xinfangfangia sp. CPCC 101601]|uniref:shikimate dehydrogenase (NADP(+)) n=1 Tax=Pseudogemmobacter lacusdianii TaxID=3069608 RepID=A0ABU0W2E0_9RHOB|nr:shikimate dehydrogenase [Xinfangfangia sp. CPCC 101601]MDQ2067948.1 shikimate dehydrogenase [Xinfangfangia sp. CPCC 101601]
MKKVIAVQITGETDLFYIVGSPVRHFRSPGLFTAQFAAKGRDAVAAPLHVLPQDLPAALEFVRRTDNIKGLCMTIPHKIAAAALVDQRTPAAERTGSVNFIRRESDGTLTGHNIDGEGFMRGLVGTGFDPAGAKVIQIGSGGVGRAIAFSLAAAGIASLTLINRNVEKAATLAAEVEAATGVPCRALAADEAAPLAEADLVVNATSLGMGGEGGSPLALAGLRSSATVADVVISATDTPFTAEARALGCRVMQGGAMLAPQIELCEEFLYG